MRLKPSTFHFPSHRPSLTSISNSTLRHPIYLSLPRRNNYIGSVPGSPPLVEVTNILAPHLGHIRILSLNSPRNRNAISWQLLRELREEIARVQSQGDIVLKRKSIEDERSTSEALLVKRVGDGVERSHGDRVIEPIKGPTRVLILASEVDNVFCAGADLKERQKMTRQETNTFLATLRSTLTSLSAFSIPTISALSATALGGGFELALATHLRVFASTASVGLPESRLAIIPGAGGTYRLRALVGESCALELILTGRKIDASEAYRLGICQRFVEVPTGREGEAKRIVLDAAVGVAKEICDGGPGSAGAVLRAVREGTEEAEGREYDSVLGMEDRNEALRAFKERRKPVFTAS